MRCGGVLALSAMLVSACSGGAGDGGAGPGGAANDAGASSWKDGGHAGTDAGSHPVGGDSGTLPPPSDGGTAPGPEASVGPDASPGADAGSVPAGFVFSPYKDTSINMNWNTNVISTAVPGAATGLAGDLVASGGKTVTLAFATGECGSENWGGVQGAAMATRTCPS